MACPPCDQREKELLVRCVAVDKALFLRGGSFCLKGAVFRRPCNAKGS